MTAKEYLKQIDHIYAKIENSIEEVNRWKDIANNTSACMSGERVQSSGNHDTIEKAICTYMDIERESLDALKKRKEEIFKNLEKLPADEYDFLFKAYVLKFTFKEIAYGKKKSYSWATTTHRNALNHLQKIIDAEKLRKEKRE